MYALLFRLPSVIAFGQSMPPDATMNAPMFASYYQPRRVDEEMGDDYYDEDDDLDIDAQWKREQLLERSNHSSDGDTVPHPLTALKNSLNGGMISNGDPIDGDVDNNTHEMQLYGGGKLPPPHETTAQHEHTIGESQRIGGDNASKEPLHKSLHGNFHTELTSLREATIEALQLSCQEQERLCIVGEELESRIAYLRKKISLARDELGAKEALSGEIDDDLRLSLVKEGDEEISESMHSRSQKSELTHSTVEKLSASQGVINASLTSSKQHRFSRSSHLHSSQASSISDATGVPHMSRSSLLGMLGASKNWLDQYASQSNTGSDTESGRGSAASIRLSFGTGDGMPSRWRAREKERERSAKKDEEKRLQQATTNDESNPAPPKKEISSSEKLQDLISKREREIALLEKRTLSVNEQTSSLHDTVSELETDQQLVQDNFALERRILLRELAQVESENESLERILVETGVSVEEKKISIEILATELKGAREDLSTVQNEMDRRRSERKRRARSRRWNETSGWVRKSASSLLGLVDDPEAKQEKKTKEKQKKKKQPKQQTQQQQEQQQQQSQAQKQPPPPPPQAVQDPDGTLRYQVPTDAMHHYKTLVHSSDEDTSGENYENSGSGSSEYQGLDRRKSYASVGTAMSALTLDSCELVDILEQLEFDK